MTLRVLESFQFQISRRQKKSPLSLSPARGRIKLFPCCEYRCQLPAEGLASAMSGYACLIRDLAGWSNLRALGWAPQEKPGKKDTIQQCLVFWCWLCIPCCPLFFFHFYTCSTHSFCLLCEPPTHLPFFCRVPLFILESLWKICSRCVLFKGNVIFNVFSKGFGAMVTVIHPLEGFLCAMWLKWLQYSCRLSFWDWCSKLNNFKIILGFMSWSEIFFFWPQSDLESYDFEYQSPNPILL